jgi:5-methyltetrahydrofolate--homocysteine methyltransferase
VAPGTVEERLKHALLKGVTEPHRSLTRWKRWSSTPAAQGDRGPLMERHEHRGDLFGAGKMFLPQVVKSARVMKESVAVLLPFMEAEKKASGRQHQAQGKVLLATVKGDVHDIGKNIVGVVLGCNNYEVIDLGVMVSAEKILRVAREENVDVIGLSGLITPSLDEMIHVAREMTREGFTVPLLIGGATTSRVHTAVKIAPSYAHGVLHVLDASRAVGVVQNLVQPDQRAAFLEKAEAEQQAARDQYAGKRRDKSVLSLAAARANRTPIPGTPATSPCHRSPGRACSTTSRSRSWSRISTGRPSLWPGSCGASTRRSSTTRSSARTRAGSSRTRRRCSTGSWTKSCSRRAACTASGPRTPRNDDIVLENGVRLPMLRQQGEKSAGSFNKSLADFVAPKETGLQDYLGAFAVTAGWGVEELVARFKADHDDYNAILLSALADRLAEAFAERLHEIARADWGYGRNESLSREDLIRERYRGIRPAPGYPACPDHTDKPALFALLGANEATGITLTESLAMHPRRVGVRFSTSRIPRRSISPSGGSRATRSRTTRPERGCPLRRRSDGSRRSWATTRSRRVRRRRRSRPRRPRSSRP